MRDAPDHLIMLRFKLMAIAVLAAASSSSCYVDDGYGYDVDYVAPGVSVVSSYDGYPVYYTNNAYWRYNNGYWYSSPYYNRGWAYATPPVGLRTYAPYGYYYGHGNYGHGYYGHGYGHYGEGVYHGHDGYHAHYGGHYGGGYYSGGHVNGGFNGGHVSPGAQANRGAPGGVTVHGGGGGHHR